MKELEVLSASGHGRMVPDAVDQEFGSGIWTYSDQRCEINLFQRGLLYTEIGSPCRRVSLFDVTDIVSGLSAKIISEASLGDGSETIVPLQLVSKSGPVILGIPLVIYSGLLIAIQEIRYCL